MRRKKFDHRPARPACEFYKIAIHMRKKLEFYKKILLCSNEVAMGKTY